MRLRSAALASHGAAGHKQHGKKAEDDHEYDNGNDHANDDDVAVPVLHGADRIGLCEASDQARVYATCPMLISTTTR